ncbi:hypothetical protein ACXAT3_000156 [Clostridium sporogenes]
MIDRYKYNEMLGYMLTKYNNISEDKVNTKQFKDIFDLFLLEYKNIHKIFKSVYE